MRTRSFVADGLWQCLCPSYSAGSLRTLTNPQLRPKRPSLLLKSPSKCLQTRLGSTRPPSNSPKTRDTRLPNFMRKSRPNPPKGFETFEPLRDPRTQLPIFQPSPNRSSEEPIQDIYDKLRYAAEIGDVARVRRLVRYLIERRDEEPNRDMYSAMILVNVSQDQGNVARVRLVLEEMEKAGIRVDAGVCEDLIKVLAVHPDHTLLSATLSHMHTHWYHASHLSRHYLIAAAIRSQNFELALHQLAQLSSSNHRIQPWLFELVYYSLAEADEVDEALGLVRTYEESGDWRPEPTLWWHLLDLCASARHHAGTVYVWRKRVEPGYLNPAAGICQNVLITAARNGDEVLANSALFQLSKRGMKKSLEQYELLAETYLMLDTGLPAALVCYAMVSTEGLSLEYGSTRPLFRYLSIDLTERAPEVVRALRDVKERLGHEIPLVVYNTVLESLAHKSHWDMDKERLETAMDVYKTLHTIVPAGPDAKTFEILVGMCEKARRKDLVSFLVEERAALGVEAKG